MKFEYPKDMDKEMIPLCDELNDIPGVSTKACCCGHCRKTDEFYIWLYCDSLKSLKVIANSFSKATIYPKKFTKSENQKEFDELHLTAWYVLDMIEFSDVPDNLISVRISNNLFNYLNKRERQVEIRNLINILKNNRKKYLKED